MVGCRSFRRWEYLMCRASIVGGNFKNETERHERSGVTGALRSSRRGFTIVEFVVVIGVLSLLVAILLPAVQRSRAAAQRVSCVNHLKQIVLASQQYHDQFGLFPSGDRHIVRLLPFLEQAALQTLILGGTPSLGAANTAAVSPAVLQCPSDPLFNPSGLDCSYFYSSGSGRFEFTLSGYEYNGMSQPALGGKAVSLRDVTDGTSTTAMYSERLSGGDRNSITDSDAARNREPYIWYMNRDYTLPTELEKFRSDCLQTRSAYVVPTLSPIYEGLTAIVGYNHLVPPNHPGCYSIARPRHHAVDFFNGAIPATSLHSGGVQTAFVDGHVAFVSDAVDGEVWMNLGSRNGGEADVGGL